MAKSFRYALMDHLIGIIEEELGAKIKKVTKYIPTGLQPLEDFPCIMVAITNKSWEMSEIGPGRDEIHYKVSIYYLDVITDENFETGEDRRDEIMHQLEKRLEIDFNLGGFRHQATVDETMEIMYDAQLENTLFEVSGQEDYYTFVSEIMYTVKTAKV